MARFAIVWLRYADNYFDDLRILDSTVVCRGSHGHKKFLRHQQRIRWSATDGVHHQLHGRGSYFRLPGRSLQPQIAHFRWNVNLVRMHSVCILYHQSKRKFNVQFFLVLCKE